MVTKYLYDEVVDEMKQKTKSTEWVRIENFVGYEWWKKMLSLHGSQSIDRNGCNQPPVDEHDYMIDWKINMLLTRIFMLTRASCEVRLPKELVTNIGWAVFDTATNWGEVSRRLNSYTAETEDELLRLVKFLEQTIVWGSDGNTDGWHCGEKPKDMHKIWDSYYEEPELIKEFLLGHINISLGQVDMERAR